MAKSKLKNKWVNIVKASNPLSNEVKLSCVYDKEWKTHFVTLSMKEKNLSTGHIVSDETVLCINNKKELNELVNLFKSLEKKLKS